MVEEFDLLEEIEVQFCDEECTEPVWHGVKYSESLFCREKQMTNSISTYPAAILVRRCLVAIVFCFMRYTSFFILFFSPY